MAVKAHGERDGTRALAGSKVVYLVMELVDGPSLGQVLTVGRPSVDDVVAWVDQLCRGGPAGAV